MKRRSDAPAVGDFIADTSFLIDLMRSHAAAVAFARSGPGSRILVHPASEAEVLVGARDLQDLRDIVFTLRKFSKAQLDPKDFHHCLAFVRRYTLTHGIGWPDCLIAATAVRLRLPVVTINDRHFRAVRGLKVVRPY